MNRYFTKSAAVFPNDECLAITADEIILEDDAPVTGLLDARGTPIYCIRDRLPFGVVANKGGKDYA